MPNKDQDPPHLSRRDRRLQQRQQMRNAAPSTDGGPLTRRNFLIALGGGAAVGGAIVFGGPVVMTTIDSPLHNGVEGNEPRLVRRTEGTWSTEDVEQLATLMQAEPDYTSISHAGAMLLGNQKGEKTFSRESVMFTDNLVKIITAPKIETPGALTGRALVLHSRNFAPARC